MKRPRPWSAALCGLTLAVATPAALAEDYLAPNATWQIAAHVARTAASPLGRALLDRVAVQIDHFEEMRFGLTDSLGMDPIEDIGHVVMSGNYESARHGGVPHVALAAEMLAGRGNLEGWMLGLPGYESEDLDDQTLLHSFTMHDQQQEADGGEGHASPRRVHRLFVALPETPEGDVLLVAGVVRDDAVRLTRAAQAGELSLRRSALRGDRLATLSVRQLQRIPTNDREPGSAVLRSLEAARATLRSGDALSLTLDLTAQSPARARQVAQMVQGLLAFTQVLAANDPRAQPLVDLALQIDVDVDEEIVTARFEGDHEQLLQALEKLDR